MYLFSLSRYCYLDKHCLFFYLFIIFLVELGLNDMSTLVGHFVSSPRENEKTDRGDGRGDEREGKGRKRNRNKSEETEENKNIPPQP